MVIVGDRGGFGCVCVCVLGGVFVNVVCISLLLSMGSVECKCCYVLLGVGGGGEGVCGGEKKRIIKME